MTLQKATCSQMTVLDQAVLAFLDQFSPIDTEEIRTELNLLIAPMISAEFQGRLVLDNCVYVVEDQTLVSLWPLRTTGTQL